MHKKVDSGGGDDAACGGARPHHVQAPPLGPVQCLPGLHLVLQGG